jgi:hypothetical protein
VKSQENFFASLGNDFKCNPKWFWSILKQKSKSRNIANTISSAGTNIDQEVHSSRISAENPVDIANMFNNYFTSVYTSDKCANEDTDCEQVDPVTSDLNLTVEEMQAVLENLDATKATGTDNIPAQRDSSRHLSVSVNAIQ